MTLLDRVQVLLPYGPVGLRAGIEFTRAIHRQRRRGVIEDEPLDPVDPGEVLEEILWVAFEDHLDVRLIALEDEWSGTDGGLDFLEIAILLHHLRGDDPHAPWVGQ